MSAVTKPNSKRNKTSFTLESYSTKESFSAVDTIKSHRDKAISPRNVVKVVSFWISEVVNINSIDDKKEKNANESLESKRFRKELEYQKKSYFYNSIVPNIMLKEYLERISYHSKAKVSTLILMSMYVDRLVDKCKFILTLNNVYR